MIAYYSTWAEDDACVIGAQFNNGRTTIWCAICYEPNWLSLVGDVFLCREHR